MRSGGLNLLLALVLSVLVLLGWIDIFLRYP